MRKVCPKMSCYHRTDYRVIRTLSIFIHIIISVPSHKPPVFIGSRGDKLRESGHRKLIDLCDTHPRDPHWLSVSEGDRRGDAAAAHYSRSLT